MKHSHFRKDSVLYARERSWLAQLVYGLGKTYWSYQKHQSLSLHSFSVHWLSLLRAWFRTSLRKIYTKLWQHKNTKENNCFPTRKKKHDCILTNVFFIGINRLLVTKHRKVGLSNRKPLPRSIKSVKKFPVLSGTRNFIRRFTRDGH